MLSRHAPSVRRATAAQSGGARSMQARRSGREYSPLSPSSRALLSSSWYGARSVGLPRLRRASGR